MAGNFLKPSKKKGKKTIHSINVYKIICGVGIFVLLTIVLTLLIVNLTVKGYFIYSMEFKPGIYIFTPNGDYYYYPSSSANTTLIVLGGGNIGVNGWIYLNKTTIQPGNYSILVIPMIDFNKDFNNNLPLGAMASLLITMLLCKLASRLEKHSSKPTSQVV